jgi:hypothetical protein
MGTLIILAVLVAGGFTFIIVRLSVSCMFWASKHRFDKMHVFKYFFPYYIITLFSICVIAILGLNKNLYATFYFSSVFIIALLIWRYEIKQSKKTKHLINKNSEQPHPELP